MRIQPSNLRPKVIRGINLRRPIVLTFAGLAISMTAAEAHRLADQLHDAAEGIR